MTTAAHPNIRPARLALDATSVMGRYGDMGHYFTAQDGHRLFIVDKANAGHVPEKLRASANQRGRFTKAGLERAILDHHEATRDTLAEDREWDRVGGTRATTFHKKLPGEVKHYLEGNPAARRLFQVTDDPTHSYGADALGELGDDRYFEHVDRLHGSTLKAAKRTAAQSDDPEVRYLNTVHSNLPTDDATAHRRSAAALRGRANRVLGIADPKKAQAVRAEYLRRANAHAEAAGAAQHTEVVPVKPGELRVGAEFTAHGVGHRVAEDEGGMRVLQHGPDYRDVTPLDALSVVGVDQGSYKPGRTRPDRGDAYEGTARRVGKGKVGAQVDDVPFGGERQPLDVLAMAAGPFKYASTQVNLPHPLSTALQRFAASIPDAHLAEDGREGEPHVTVRYGLKTDDPAEAQRAMRKPMRHMVPADKSVRLGRLSLFPATFDRQSDVLKLNVDSPYLHHLNGRLKHGVDCKDTHPTYTPHATVAYLKPGMGKLYARKAVDGVTGESFIPDAVHFCHKTGGRTSIPFRGEPLALAADPGPKPASAEVLGKLGEWGRYRTISGEPIFFVDSSKDAPPATRAGWHRQQAKGQRLLAHFDRERARTAEHKGDQAKADHHAGYAAGREEVAAQHEDAAKHHDAEAAKGSGPSHAGTPGHEGAPTATVQPTHVVSRAELKAGHPLPGVTDPAAAKTPAEHAAAAKYHAARAAETTGDVKAAHQTAADRHSRAASMPLYNVSTPHGRMVGGMARQASENAARVERAGAGKATDPTAVRATTLTATLDPATASRKALIDYAKTNIGDEHRSIVGESTVRTQRWDDADTKSIRAAVTKHVADKEHRAKVDEAAKAIGPMHSRILDHATAAGPAWRQAIRDVAEANGLKGAVTDGDRAEVVGAMASRLQRAGVRPESLKMPAGASPAATAKPVAAVKVASIASAPASAKPLTPSVGDKLTYTGRAGSMPAEFRGFHNDPATGEKVARVIVRPEKGPPFEASVKPSELSAPTPPANPPADPVATTHDTAAANHRTAAAKGGISAGAHLKAAQLHEEAAQAKRSGSPTYASAATAAADKSAWAGKLDNLKPGDGYANGVQPAAATTDAAPSPADAAFGAAVNAAAARVVAKGEKSTSGIGEADGQGRRGSSFGPDKAFIHAVHAEYQPPAGQAKPSLDQFKRMLTDANTAGTVKLEPADLVAAMHPQDVEDSRANHLSGVFNFVKVPTAGQPATADDPERFGNQVNAAAARVVARGERTGPTTRGTSFGAKALIHGVHAEHQADPSNPRMTLDQFKDRLADASAEGTVKLSRADLVAAMHPQDLADAKMQRLGQVLHFVNPPAARYDADAVGTAIVRSGDQPSGAIVKRDVLSVPNAKPATVEDGWDKLARMERETGIPRGGITISTNSHHISEQPSQIFAAVDNEHLDKVPANWSKAKDQGLMPGLTTKFHTPELDDISERMRAQQAKRLQATAPPKMLPGGTRYDAAGTSSVRPGLFGQPTVDPIGSKQSADLFHKPVDAGAVVLKGETAADRAAAKKYDPADTGKLPYEAAPKIQSQYLAGRFRPDSYHAFMPPIVGPSGAQLVGYGWSHRSVDDGRQTHKHSDWTGAVPSDATGRKLVHQFDVVPANGGERLTVSHESVAKHLGYTGPEDASHVEAIKSAVKTLANLKVERQALADRATSARAAAVEANGVPEHQRTQAQRMAVNQHRAAVDHLHVHDAKIDRALSRIDAAREAIDRERSGDNRFDGVPFSAGPIPLDAIMFAAGRT